MKWLTGVLLVLAGCTDRTTDAKLICHNANCATNAAIEDDDTLDATAGVARLAHPRAAGGVDGIELDSVWIARAAVARSATPTRGRSCAR